jgi:peroxiredoxin Q/BCP
VAVVGVSKDTVSAQANFAKKNELTFPLMADSKGVVIRRYGVDLAFGIAKRKTFLIDSKGKIAKIYESVSPKTHAAEVAEALKDVG